MPGNTGNLIIPIPGSFTEKLELAKAKELASERSRLKSQRKALERQPSKPVFTNYSALQVSSIGHGVGESKSSSLGMQASLDEEVSGASVDHENSEDLVCQKVDLPAVKNCYAGLISAKKRKRGGQERNMTSSLIAKPDPDIVPIAVNVEDSHVKGKGPFAPVKKPARMHRPTYGTIDAAQTPVETRTTLHSADWYQQIDMKVKYSRSDLESLKRLSSMISECVRQSRAEGDLGLAFSRLRQRIHQMEFYDFLSGVLIKKSKVLEKEGLPAIFEGYGNIEYPWDIKSDSLALYHRWLAGRLDPHLLVGIDTKLRTNGNGKESKARSLQRDYPSRISCNTVGDNDLQNGMWWPYQLAAMRDGAHGEVEAGIHGKSGEGKGAYSIVLSSGGYADVDSGETIQYCGTSGTDGQATAGTKFMKVTAQLRNPVRVLRSAALPADNPYRPSKGIRYDGLYDVVSYKVLDKETAMHQFHLIRKSGQDPIRYQGLQQRPTLEQLEAYAKIRKLLGLHS